MSTTTPKTCGHTRHVGVCPACQRDAQGRHDAQLAECSALGSTRLDRSLRLMGYPDAEIARLSAKPTAAAAVERIGRILATFDALSPQRKSAVSPRELIEDVREAIGR